MTGTQLANWLKENRMTRAEAARRLGWKPVRVREAVACGEQALSEFRAARFEALFAQVETDDRERLGGTP